MALVGSIYSPLKTSLIISARLKALSLFVCGGMLVYIVGFAPISAIHNAAHDNRHTAAFPCH